MKTIEDVTLEEWGQLALEAADLLAMVRFIYFTEELDADDDPSYRDQMKRMERALEAVGLRQVSLEEYIQNLEELLASHLTPAEFWKKKRAEQLLQSMDETACQRQ
jgi:hypothetical protein